MDSAVAPVTLQESVDEDPAVMLDGVAVKDEMTGTLVRGEVGESLVEPPPHAEMTMHARATVTRKSLLLPMLGVATDRPWV